MPRAPRLVWTQRHMHQSQDGLEYYHYPSALAQRCWYYVTAIGQARVPPGYHFRMQAQPGYLLHYIARGHLQQRIARQRYELTPGAVALMDRSQAIETRNRSTAPTEIWWVTFNGRDLPHLFSALRADQWPVFPLVDAPAYAERFTALLAVIARQPPGQDAHAFALLAGLLAELFAARQGGGEVAELLGGKTVQSEPVRRALDYLARFHMEATLDSVRLSEAAGISPRHLHRLFTSELGVTPMQCLRRYRIERAKELLATTDLPLEQLCHLLGIPNQSHFGSLFRQLTGQTPRQYRRAARAE